MGLLNKTPTIAATVYLLWLLSTTTFGTFAKQQEKDTDCEYEDY